MEKKSVRIFLDANVVIQSGKPPGGPIWKRLEELVKAEFINVITTDLTVKEVAKKHAENDYDVIKEIGRPHFRKVVQDALDIELPNIKKTYIQKILQEKYEKNTEAMFAAVRAESLSIDSVKPWSVFSAYSNGTGFFTGEGKKHQFPDAFIFERLKMIASEENPIAIVSSDGDFAEPCKAEPHFSFLNTISDLFKSLGLEIDAPDINAFFDAQHDQIKELVESETNDWELQVTDVQDAYVDSAKVTDVSFPELMSFASIDNASILVIGTAEVSATVSYTHPNWDDAVYDSEDKVLIPFEDIHGETDIIFEAEFSMSILVDEEGNREIDEFRFRNDKFVWITLGSDIDY